jgi:hypothetical protein
LKGSPQSKLTAMRDLNFDFQIQEGKGGPWIWPLCSVNDTRLCALRKRANFFGVVGATLNFEQREAFFKCLCALTYSIGALAILKSTRSHPRKIFWNPIHMQLMSTANAWRKLIFCNKHLIMFWVQKRIKNIFLSQGGFHFVFPDLQLLWWGACNFCEIVIAQKQIRFRNELIFSFQFPNEAKVMNMPWQTLT